MGKQAMVLTLLLSCIVWLPAYAEDAIVSAVILDNSETQQNLIQGAKAEIERVLRKHIEGMKAWSAQRPGYDIVEKRWEQLFSEEILSYTIETAFRLTDKAIQEGRHMVEGKAFDNIYLAISVVPAIEDEKARTFFPGGYNQVLDGLLADSGWLREDRDFAHWIYCYEGTDKQKAHLTFITAKSLSGGNNFWVFAQDLMTPEEKSRIGIR